MIPVHSLAVLALFLTYGICKRMVVLGLRGLG